MVKGNCNCGAVSFEINREISDVFIHQDICSWETDECFDFIVAWDSILHLPFTMQKPVVTKPCRLLAKNGVLLYTFGNAQGEHTNQWHNDTF